MNTARVVLLPLSLIIIANTVCEAALLASDAPSTIPQLGPTLLTTFPAFSGSNPAGSVPPTSQQANPSVSTVASLLTPPLASTPATQSPLSLPPTSFPLASPTSALASTPPASTLFQSPTPNPQSPSLAPVSTMFPTQVVSSGVGPSSTSPSTSVSWTQLSPTTKLELNATASTTISTSTPASPPSTYQTNTLSTTTVKSSGTSSQASSTLRVYSNFTSTSNSSNSAGGNSTPSTPLSKNATANTTVFSNSTSTTSSQTARMSSSSTTTSSPTSSRLATQSNVSNGGGNTTSMTFTSFSNATTVTNMSMMTSPTVASSTSVMTSTGGKLLVAQQVILVFAESYDVVFGPNVNASTPSTPLSKNGTANTSLRTSENTSRMPTVVPGTTIAKQVPFTAAANSTVVTNTTMAKRAPFTTAAANSSISINSTASYNSTSIAAIRETTTSYPVAQMYAAFLVPRIAAAANVSNSSRIVNVTLFSDPDTNKLVTQFTILDGVKPTAAQAVAILKISTTSNSTTPSTGVKTNRRRRRGTPVQTLFTLIDMYNQTLNAIHVVNWTDFGPCPNQSCLSNEICIGRSSGEVYCDCLTPDICSANSSSNWSTTSPWSCRTDIKCIVPAIVVPVVIGLLIVVIAAIVIVKVMRGKETTRNSRTNDRRSDIPRVPQAYSIYETSDTLPMKTKIPLSDDEKHPQLSKDESRSRYKRVKRGMALNDIAGAADAADAAADVVEPQAISGRRNSHDAVLFVDDSTYSKTGTMNSEVSLSRSGVAADLGEHTEILSY